MSNQILYKIKYYFGFAIDILHYFEYFNIPLITIPIRFLRDYPFTIP